MSPQEEILARCAALVPALEARAAEGERLRRLPDETIADAVAGGHRVSGRWEWATGVMHADWVMVHALGSTERGPTTRFCFVPPRARLRPAPDRHAVTTTEERECQRTRCDRSCSSRRGGCPGASTATSTA